MVCLGSSSSLDDARNYQFEFHNELVHLPPLEVTSLCIIKSISIKIHWKGFDYFCYIKSTLFWFSFFSGGRHWKYFSSLRNNFVTMRLTAAKKCFLTSLKNLCFLELCTYLLHLEQTVRRQKIAYFKSMLCNVHWNVFYKSFLAINFIVQDVNIQLIFPKCSSKSCKTLCTREKKHNFNFDCWSS